MKRIILVAACLLPVLAFGQKRFTINGKIGAQAGAEIAYIYNKGKLITTDSAVVKNGKFSFSGSIDEPQEVRLYIRHKEDAGKKLFALRDQLNFFIDPGNITISSPDLLKHATISGSPTTQENITLAAIAAPLQRAKDSLANLALGYQMKQVNYFSEHYDMLLGDSPLRARMDANKAAMKLTQEFNEKTRTKTDSAAYNTKLTAYNNIIGSSIDLMSKTGEAVDTLRAEGNPEFNDPALKSKLDSIKVYQAKMDETGRKFIETHPNSWMALILLSVNTRHGMLKNNLDVKKTLAAFDRFSPEIKATPSFKEELGLVENYAALATKKHKAPDFTHVDIDGKTLSLSSFKGKYLLLDFWASWCVPCRGENPNVVKAFNKYKDKGLEILSVSLDKDPAKWRAAVKQDGMPWNHMDDKGTKDGIANLYKVIEIPTNFLIDPDGNIIAFNLRGAALEEELAKVIK
ncbi:MAG: AhpC/TSA family protein [Mucilaginibacter sp.]|nr:AhpC/TSA family protein [Mucilaginibacter sp.]